jgi:hypothetical protein
MKIKTKIRAGRIGCGGPPPPPTQDIPLDI